MPSPDEPATYSMPAAIPLLLREVIHERTGLFFEPDRFDMMLDKLRDRLAATGCESFLDYYYVLKYEEKGPDEWRRVSDALSVQETYFWREPSQIRAVVKTIVPEWFKARPAPLRIWSAACATGEEPLSLMIALREAKLDHLPIEIVGSDASEAALAKARQGVFRERSFRTLPEDLRRKYFTPVSDGWKIDESLHRRVTFQRANLAASLEIAPLAIAPIIFCRNVFIYFSPDSIQRTLAEFRAHMPPGGFLFVGASESLLKLTRDFELQEINDAFVYVRQPGLAKAVGQ